VNGVETSKTTIGREKEVSIGTSQMGMCIKSDTIHQHKDGFVEVRVVEEFHKVCVMISHGKRLDYSPSPILHPLYFGDFTA
jgi:hypothetical protein